MPEVTEVETPQAPVSPQTEIAEVSVPDTKTAEQDGPAKEELETGQERDENGKFKAKTPLFTDDQQKAFDKALGRKARQIESRLRAELVQGAAPAQAQQPATHQVSAAEEPKAPDVDNYTDLVEYNKDVKSFADRYKAWVVAQQQQEAAKKEQKEITERWNKSVAKYRQTHAESFDEAVEEIRTIEHPALQEAVVRFAPPDVVDYLGHNLDEFDRLRSLPEAEMLFQLGSLVRDLSQKNTSPAEPITAGKPAQSRAPKPPTPVTKPATTDNSLRDDLDGVEWLRRRNKQVEEGRSR